MVRMCTLLLILFFLCLLMMIAISNFSFEQDPAFGGYLILLNE